MSRVHVTRATCPPPPRQAMGFGWKTLRNGGHSQVRKIAKRHGNLSCLLSLLGLYGKQRDATKALQNHENESKCSRRCRFMLTTRGDGSGKCHHSNSLKCPNLQCQSASCFLLLIRSSCTTTVGALRLLEFGGLSGCLSFLCTCLPRFQTWY